MAVTRLQMQTSIYDILSKSASSAGLLTPSKVNEAIQDALDMVQAKMVKINGGWLSDVKYANYTANSALVTLPPGLIVVNFVKWKSDTNSDYYAPITFDENALGSTATTSSAGQGGLPFWRFSGQGTIRLEPIPATTIANGVMFDGIFLRDAFTTNADEFDGDLDNRIFTTYIKWRAASILRSLTTKEDPPWLRIEKEWEMQVNAMIARKMREPTMTRSFPNL